jgi:hypothetical protein
VWDRKSEKTSGTSEGIGSIFQFRKQSFIAKHILKGEWIGSLVNSHQKQEGDQSSYFGLSSPHCDQSNLIMYEKKNSSDFIYVPKTTSSSSIRDIIKRTKVKNTTVFVFDWETVDERHNFIVFDSLFRKRFHDQRALRQTPKRKPDEYWVSIHFRWGDVETEDISQPDLRTGLPFSDYCLCIRYMLHLNPRIKIFMFAENFERVDLCQQLKSTNVQFFNDSKSWKRDIDIMSQSHLLIGGTSSFFVLGAHLCEVGTRCTVIHGGQKKFSESSYEKRLPKHLNSISCPSSLRCYRENIREYIQMD